MSANVNKIDYDVLDAAKTVYANQAEALDEIINTLVNMNAELAEGWTNNTSRAFIERFEGEHKIALEEARDAIQSISEYIVSYVTNRQDEDASSAGSISR